MTTRMTRATRPPVETKTSLRLPIGTIVKDTVHDRVGTIFDYGEDRDGTTLYYLRATRGEFEAEAGSELEWSCDVQVVIELTGWQGQAT